MNFKNKTAIITGAGIGIGFEIARQLALAGASVLLNDIDEQVAIAAAERINEEGGICKAISGDAGEVSFINKMIETAIENFDRLDIAIANAGITTFGTFLDYEESDFQKLVAVNLRGSFFLAQAAAKQMIHQNIPGRILLMSSVTGHQVHPNLAAYSMTKSALETLAKNLGVELAPHQITVNTIAPGATITQRNLEHDPNYKSNWEKITPSGKIAKPDDIAHAAMFLLSPLSSHITGQSLVVDGGWTLLSPPPEE